MIRAFCATVLDGVRIAVSCSVAGGHRSRPPLSMDAPGQFANVVMQRQFTSQSDGGSGCL
jgi:hypothetical protein